jgi:biopolymer transport protein ExbB
LNYDPAKIEEQVVKAMEDYSSHITAALEKNLSILSTVATVAPMLGSLGTVVGMVLMFQGITEMRPEDNIIKQAAAGIKVKLIVTVWGLMVGIPAYMFFNYFTSKSDVLWAGLDERVAALATRLAADEGADASASVAASLAFVT